MKYREAADAMKSVISSQVDPSGSALLPAAATSPAAAPVVVLTRG
jgi:hypothetical protein